MSDFDRVMTFPESVRMLYPASVSRKLRDSRSCGGISMPVQNVRKTGSLAIARLRMLQSSFSGSIWMFFSPAAFFSQYFLTQASNDFPAAVSRPVNASAATSE